MRYFANKTNKQETVNFVASNHTNIGNIGRFINVFFEFDKRPSQTALLLYKNQWN